MARIKRVGYFDTLKLKKMISFLSTEVIEHYSKVFINLPFNFIHNLLPLRFKKLPETYIIEENKEILGMITVSPTPGNPFKLVISRLFLEQDCFNAGKQLIDFVISKYGAKGATTFLSVIDDSYNELLYLFADECGFRQCSSEQLWKIEEIRIEESQNTLIRTFKNTDAQAVATLFNDSIITHFKYSISKTKEEYLEPIFKGLSENYELKFIAEDNTGNTIKALFSIKTCDNINYILDITNSPWYDCSFEDILNFSVSQILKRQKNFNLFIKLKKYTTTADSIEEYLKSKGATCIQNQLILVKDFHRVIKEPQQARQIVLFNSINEKPVFKI